MQVEVIVFRPDIAMFELRPRMRKCKTAHTRWQDASWMHYEGARVVHILELGYVREGFGNQKMQEKRAQHELLSVLLKDLNWTVHYHTATIGVTGAVYKDTLTALSAMGVSSSACDTVISAIVHMTLNHTHGLVVQRRQLDSHLVKAAYREPP